MNMKKNSIIYIYLSFASKTMEIKGDNREINVNKGQCHSFYFLNPIALIARMP